MRSFAIIYPLITLGKTAGVNSFSDCALQEQHLAGKKTPSKCVRHLYLFSCFYGFGFSSAASTLMNMSEKPNMYECMFVTLCM